MSSPPVLPGEPLTLGTGRSRHDGSRQQAVMISHCSRDSGQTDRLGYGDRQAGIWRQTGWDVETDRLGYEDRQTGRLNGTELEGEEVDVEEVKKGGWVWRGVDESARLTTKPH